MEAGVDYYEKKDYYRSIQLFEELMPLYRGTSKGEKVAYYYAYCQYGLQDWFLAAYHFGRYVETYPNSDRAEECHFRKAYCYYLDSPISSLDQTNTKKAINEMQLFVNKYPASDRLDECNKLIDQLRKKIVQKDYENAKLYFKIKDYQSAITALGNVAEDYPEIDQIEEVKFLILKSHYELAVNSVISKQQQRLNDTIKEYKEFIVNFPDSNNLKDAERMYSDASGLLNKILNQ